eukprot:437489-Amphidinium_carterae.1
MVVIEDSYGSSLGVALSREIMMMSVFISDASKGSQTPLARTPLHFGGQKRSVGCHPKLETPQNPLFQKNGHKM